MASPAEAKMMIQKPRIAILITLNAKRKSMRSSGGEHRRNRSLA